MFITFEGIDGAGKSTHIEATVQHLMQQGFKVTSTREPGGTTLGEAIRSIVLNQDMDLETESLLMFAARKEHIHQVIQPALSRGEVVVCDRFTDATFAYQGAGRGLDWSRLSLLEDWVQQGLQPDITIIFDISPDIAAQRMQSRASASDKFEVMSTDFFDRVRHGYLKRAQLVPNRYCVLDASQTLEAIRTQVLDAVDQAVARATPSWVRG